AERPRAVAQGGVGGQGGLGVAAGEVNRARVAADGVVGGVQGRHREVERRPGRGAGGRGHLKVSDGGADRDGAAGGGERVVDRIRRRDGLDAGRLQGGAERARAPAERRVDGENGGRVAAAEVDRTRV